MSRLDPAHTVAIPYGVATARNWLRSRAWQSMVLTVRGILSEQFLAPDEREKTDD
jgi:hypothetical protein